MELYPDLPSHIYADAYIVYPDMAGTVPLTQSKTNTFQIEQNNGRQRRWLACFHRRSQGVVRSLPMLPARLKLFARYRINGSIQELTALYRRKPLYLS
jgi:IS1 family transposase